VRSYVIGTNNTTCHYLVAVLDPDDIRNPIIDFLSSDVAEKRTPLLHRCSIKAGIRGDQIPMCLGMCCLAARLSVFQLQFDVNELQSLRLRADRLLSGSRDRLLSGSQDRLLSGSRDEHDRIRGCSSLNYLTYCEPNSSVEHDDVVDFHSDPEEHVKHS